MNTFDTSDLRRQQWHLHILRYVKIFSVDSSNIHFSLGLAQALSVIPGVSLLKLNRIRLTKYD